jgi:uncharacterized protein YjbI with pentapeptide repeats
MPNAIIVNDNSIDAEELIGRYAAGERNFVDISLRWEDLSGANLTGVNLTGAIFVRVNFSRANLSSANLTNTSLKSANLSGANLEGADLTNASIDFANLENANLKGAIGSFYPDGMAFYSNTILPDGSVFVGPSWMDVK